MVEFPLSYVSEPPEGVATGSRVILLLHGYGADEHDLLPYAEYLLADAHVLSVRGPHEANAAGYAWMSSGRDPFETSTDVLGEFVARIPAAYDVDPERVGLFGFSQGAKVALAALVADPDRYAWAVSLNGYLPRGYRDRVARAREKSVFVGVGADDSVISPEHGEETADLLADAGLDVTFRSYPVGHRIVREEVEDVTAWLEHRE